jgi:hypothetical protein
MTAFSRNLNIRVIEQRNLIAGARLQPATRSGAIRV